MVSFSISHNCQLCKEFTPYRWSRQAQILSPCLIFLCAEAHSELILLAISPNSFHSVKFCTNAHFITEHKSLKEGKEITIDQHNELHNNYSPMISVLIPPKLFLSVSLWASIVILSWVRILHVIYAKWKLFDASDVKEWNDKSNYSDMIAKVLFDFCC